MKDLNISADDLLGHLKGYANWQLGNAESYLIAAESNPAANYRSECRRLIYLIDGAMGFWNQMWNLSVLQPTDAQRLAIQELEDRVNVIVAKLEELDKAD